MKKHYLFLILLSGGSLFFSCSKKSDDVAPATHGTFNIAGAVYQGSTSAATFNGGVEVEIVSGGNYMQIYNMPSAEGGTFDVFNTFQTGVLQSSTDVYASSNVNIGVQTDGSASLSGKLTKTGARSFTFTGTFQANLSSSTTAAVIASGSY
jgi:hypothetical protein